MNKPSPIELETLASLLQPNIESAISLDRSSLSRLDYHGIAALTYDNLSQQGSLKQHLSAELESSLRDRQSLMVANEALRLNELKILFKAFEQANLQNWLVFKGTALAYSCYDKAWLRPRTDTDILISEHQLAEFSQVFEALGYQREFAITGDLITYQCTFGKRLVGKATINIDIHWRINNRQCLANAFTLNGLQKSAQRMPILGENVRIPNNVDSLIIACLHRLGHHHTEERLAWLYDIQLLCKDMQPADWQALVDNAIDKKLAALCFDGLITSQKYFNFEILESTKKSLSKIQKSTEPSSLYLDPDLSNWQILKSDLASIKSWQSKLRFLMQTAIPSPTYIRKQMNTKSAMLGYLKRSIKGLRRLLRKS